MNAKLTITTDELIAIANNLLNDKKIKSAIQENTTKFGINFNTASLSKKSTNNEEIIIEIE